MPEIKITETLPGRKCTPVCSDQCLNGQLTGSNGHNVKGTERVLSLLLLQLSHSQVKLFLCLFRWEPHYIRINKLYGKSAVRVSFVVMNTDHKLSPQLLSLLFFIILFLALLYFRHTQGILATVFSSQLFVTEIRFG